MNPKTHLTTWLSEQPQETASGRVVQALAAYGPLTAGEISRRIGQARSTVSTALTDLRDIGLVTELPPSNDESKQVGRPVQLISLQPDSGAVAGIHLGYDFIDLVVIDAAHNLLSSLKIPMTHDYEPRDAATSCYQQMVQIFEEHTLDLNTLLGVGVSVSGPVSTEGVVLHSSIIPKWAHIKVKDVFTPIFKCPVLFENEANCAAIAEMTWGAGRDIPDFMLIKIGVGVGGALVRDGKIDRGVAGVSGEFGHMILLPDGELCGCGNRGCLETIASYHRPLRLLSERMGRSISFAEAISLARSGDKYASTLIGEAGANVGWALALIGSVLNPPLILVGGLMAQAGDLLLTPLKESFEKHSMIKPSNLPLELRTRIELASFIDDTKNKGATSLVFLSLGEIASQLRQLRTGQ